MIAVHRKLFLKISSDDAAVPEAINVLVAWCWVWASNFLVLDLIILFYVAFSFSNLLFITYSLRRRYVENFKSVTNFGIFYEEMML